VKWRALWILAALAICTCRCAPVIPPENPPAPAVDRFSNGRYDCHGLDLFARAELKPQVENCLAGPEASGCIERMSGPDALVACLVRDVGAMANAAYLAGEVGPNKLRADAAREWITLRKVRYQ
jgi:hypothetical protein